MNKAQVFRETVIQPVLARLGEENLAAEELLLGTAVQESLNFMYRRQVGEGPAKGYFQMEPSTHNDIWDNYLKYRQALANDILSFLSNVNANKIDELETNDKYATAMARVHYMRVSAPLPKAGDIAAQARYWKQYYNTPLGKGVPHEYIEKWNKYVIGTTP
ncbi:conserved hypothetical protein [Psychromonas ingrahamii 37]|uniref:Transglycosylase SLT domain-containing protein n=1 Tax=Psychromonas ingrahamii (strain DSM 17664 / CCUG 51855 / 37) TaxID=357804 RepID=A1SVT5_PSYIN|nr:hypothetical protein [Psychromonas ingrahamii]ABM03600.1 conserved hypothetical protein [Psychromonas ingrahamii 37]